MNLNICPYEIQNARWPQTGRHVLAQFDADTIVVYQAFCPRLGAEAVRLGRFGEEFSRSRMSWIKPNFLWMMFRCGWAAKENQETVLAVTLRRTAFDAILEQAVASAFDPALQPSRDAWLAAGAASEVRLQWDPDHAPDGAKQERRALQLGLRGATLGAYASEWIVSVEDITPFVTAQAAHVFSGDLSRLETPCEAVYPVPGPLAARLGMETLAATA